MRFRKVAHSFRYILVTAALLLILAPEWSASANEVNRLKGIVATREFDYLVWEANAIQNKGEALLANGDQFISETTRKDIVLNYLSLIQQSQMLEAQLSSIYGDPDVADPEEATHSLQRESRRVREELARQQALAEAIVQEQVATILVEEGFNIFGQAWPPVAMQLTPLPSLLVVSPREEIKQIHQVSLVNGLSTPEKESLETLVFKDLDRSALVVPLGGIGTFPAMIVETSDVNRLMEVVTHEWTHHWLSFEPLGISYFLDPNVRIINETVASLIDQELGQRVVERFYPEYLPEREVTSSPPPEESAPPEFDFQYELASTRTNAESLLAEGRVEDAEAYMEKRRLEFREHGYHIRKLNQAFFAFYGAYAAEPGGAQGENPIGPMLREIREHSPSIRVFLDTVAPIKSLADLQEVHSQVVPFSPPG